MDEFYREQRSGPGRQLLDLVCVALLGLILTLAAGAISRAPAAAAAPGTAGAHGKAAADCDTPAKPDQTVAAAFPLPAAATHRALRGRREARGHGATSPLAAPAARFNDPHWLTAQHADSATGSTADAGGAQHAGPVVRPGDRHRHGARVVARRHFGHFPHLLLHLLFPRPRRGRAERLPDDVEDQVSVPTRPEPSTRSSAA